MPSLTRPRKLLALAVAAILVAPLFFDLEPSRPPLVEVERRQSSQGPLSAGAGRALVELPEGARLAGYLPWGRTPATPGEPLYARALVVEAGGVRVGIVLLELLTLPETLADEVAAGAGMEVVVAATHTHSGPGGYDEALVPQLASVGRFDARVRSAEVAAARAALAAAAADLGPALLATGEGSVPDLVQSRDHPDAAVDDRVTVLSLSRPGGRPVATLARLAAHATLAPHDRGPSGDWPETAMQQLEAGGGVALILQGALGDAGPHRAEGADPVKAYAARVTAVIRGMPLSPAPGPSALSFDRVRFALPPPAAGTVVPRFLRTLAGNLLATAAPATARMATLSLAGRTTLVFVPAEPTWQAAQGIEAPLGPEARTVSVAGGYLGYAPLPQDFRDGAFSTRFSWFGPALAERLSGAVTAASRPVPAHPSR